MLALMLNMIQVMDDLELGLEDITLEDSKYLDAWTNKQINGQMSYLKVYYLFNTLR